MAWQKQKYHTTRTFVSLRGTQVVGCFSLVFGAVGRESMPRKVARGVAKEHPIPILLLARLGVCRSAQGQGLGVLLLREAIRKTAIGASVGGLCALLVDALHSLGIRSRRRPQKATAEDNMRSGRSCGLAHMYPMRWCTLSKGWLP